MDLDLMDEATEALLQGREATLGGWLSRGGLMGLFLSGGKAFLGATLEEGSSSSFKLM